MQPTSAFGRKNTLLLDPNDWPLPAASGNRQKYRSEKSSKSCPIQTKTGSKESLLAFPDESQEAGLSAAVEGRNGDHRDAVVIFVSIAQVEKKSFDGPVQSITEISEVAEISGAGPFRCFDLAGMEAAAGFEYEVDFVAGRAFIVVQMFRLYETQFSAFLKLRYHEVLDPLTRGDLYIETAEDAIVGKVGF